MKVSDTSQSYENAPAGTHLARCIGLLGVGSKETEFNGKKRWRNRIVITWELPYELRHDGQPFSVSGWYTRSLSDRATLRKDLEAWRTKQFTKDELDGFEMKNLLDKGCQVIISESEDGKTRLSGVAALPKGTTLPDRVNDLTYFDIYEYEDSDFEGVSERMQEIIKESREYQEIGVHGHILTDDERRGDEKAMAASAAGDDDPPF